MGWSITFVILIMVCQFCLITAVNFTMKSCNEEDGVTYQGSHSLFSSSVHLLPCRALSNQYLPLDVDYRIQVEFQSDGTSSPGIVFNVVDDNNYDMIYFKLNNYNCFEIASVVDSKLSVTNVDNDCDGFRLESNRAFNVELHIIDQTLQLNLAHGGTEKEFEDILKHTMHPSNGLIQDPYNTLNCQGNCEFMFRSLDLLPATDPHHFIDSHGTILTPDNGDYQLSVLRLEFYQLDHVYNHYCFVALWFKQIDIGSAVIYIQGDVEHEEGTIALYKTQEINQDIYFYSSDMGSSHSGFTLEYHVFGCGIAQPDLSFICAPGYHNDRHSDFYRSVKYDSDHSNYRSDADLPMGWYKFSSCAGTNIPNITPIQTDVCGGRNPIWMQGTNNGKSSGYSEGTACVYTDNNDCAEQWLIPYFECMSGALLYYLIPTPELSSYCVGDEILCDASLNLTSIDGSGCSPCVESHFPEMSEPHIGEWVKKSGGIYDLPCIIRPKSTELELQFQVDWYIVYPTYRDIILHIDNIMTTQALLESKELLKEHLQNEVVCEVRAKYVLGENYGPWVASDPYFIGVKILNRDENLEIGDVFLIHFQFTMPISCDGPTCMDETHANCHTDVFLLTSTKSMRQQPCQNLVYFEPELITTTTCSRNVECSKWNEVQLLAIRVKDTKQVGIPSFTHTLYAITKDNTRPMWNNLVDETKLHVLVDDEVGGSSKSTCKSHNDPHFTTFAQTRYDVHGRVEEYVLYKSEPQDDRNMKTLVTAEFSSCDGREWFCNSKLGVRVNNEAVVYDPKASREGLSALKYMGPGHGEPGFQIVALNNCEKYEFRLPRGERVIASVNRDTFLNIDIESPYEKQANLYGNGLCGKLGENLERCNDLYLRNNDRYRPDPCPEYKTPIPEFSDDWLAEPDEKLINTDEIRSVNTNISLSTYSCSVYDINDFLSSNEDRTFRETLLIEHCYPYSSDNLMDILRSQSTSAKTKIHKKPRLSATAESKKLPPVSNLKRTWTADSALEYCQAYIGHSTVAQTCNVTNADDVQFSIEECAADIELTGDTDWADGTLTSLREDCILTLYKNLTLWDYEEDGNETTLVPPQDMTQNLCPNECFGHGNCVDGYCECFQGYIKYDCSHDVTIPPTIEGVFDDGICYLGDCNDFTLLGSGIVDMGNITCHFNEQSKSEVQTRGVMTNFDSVLCSLPEVHQAPLGYNKYDVGLSNDGLLKGEGLEVVVVTAECASCRIEDTDDIQCALKSTTCLIEDTCITDGELSSSDVCLYCNSSDDQYHWSTFIGCGDESGETPPSGGTHTLLIVATVCFSAVFVIAVVGIGILFRMRIRRKQADHPNTELHEGVNNDVYCELN